MRASIWDVESTSARRNYIAGFLWANRCEPTHMFNLARCIDSLCKENNEIKKEDFHNSTYRRILTEDIDDINKDMKYHMIITSTSAGVQAATCREAQHMYDMLRGKALKTLSKAAIIAKKAGLECQIDITGEEIKIFMEESA